MGKEMKEPSEQDSIECHLQQIGMGTLICRAAKQTGEHSTNEVTPAVCFNCPAGKIYREVGCDAVLPKLSFFLTSAGPSPALQSLFCKIRKRETSLEYCRTCGLAVAETTRRIVTTARSLLEAKGFYSAYQDLEKARIGIRDGNFENAVTRSISCVESVMRTVHEELGLPLPDRKQAADLWKSTREALRIDSVDAEGRVGQLLNAMSGVIMHLGALRNALGDAHGKGKYPPAVSESIAELTLNTASTLATFVIRRYEQVKAEHERNPT